MVPNDPYQVHVTYNVGSGVTRKTYNFPTLPAAMARRDKELRGANTRTVQVSVILDETKGG